MSKVIVAKFGGTSLADSDQFKKVMAIIKSDPRRRYIVVSAPGKRNPEDRKITDLFYEWHRLNHLQLSTVEVMQIIHDRFAEIVRDLGLSLNIGSEIAEIDRMIRAGASADYSASRGEYLSGKILAEALGYDIVDPESCIIFDSTGQYSRDDERIQKRLGKGRNAVIPGFYGIGPNGKVRTFSRGGSDITGAIIARAVGASIYENWTDVSGLLMADPRVVNNPRRIKMATYRELRELAYMGASVFHQDAMFPVQEAGIITNIRNTNVPEDPGTFIVPEKTPREDARPIVGIAGRKSFTVFTVEKDMMNSQVGIARKILGAFEGNGVSIEHMPSGIDTISIIVDDEKLNGKSDLIVRQIKSECSPDSVEVNPGMAMIAVVGRPMKHTLGVAAKVFQALADNGINIRMINQGSSEISIIIGVENSDYDAAIRAIYATLE